jgi:hypothetical protein
MTTSRVFERRIVETLTSDIRDILVREDVARR